MKQTIFPGGLTDTFANDYKAEVVAAELINSGVPAEQIMMVLLGPAKRAFRKDVDAVIEEVSDHNNKEYTLITTHKEGIYDMLPEGLFHSPVLPNSAITQKDITETIKKHREEERNARRFFLPYEAGINHLRIQVALYESKMDKVGHHNELIDLFKDHWDIFNYLETNESAIFLNVLPLVHDIRDDYSLASTIFELLFSLPVKIYSRPREIAGPGDPVFSNLNDTILGIDLTTGNEFYPGGEDEIVVSIGPVNNEQLSRFAPGKRNDKILELLCDYLLPVHIDITTKFELIDTDKTTKLADGDMEFNSTLGLSTYL
jgi:type VI secretion system protein ImpH